MSVQWEPPKAEVKLAGTITYRCAACGEDIGGEPVFAPLIEGRMASDTRSYHPDHAPKEVTNGSRP